jgi:hypothetical protein
MTARQAAQQMSVSERSVYTARRIIRSGRQDLIDACERGEMSLNAALKQIDGPPKQDRYAALCRAWNAANADEQGRFLVALGWSDAAPPEATESAGL